MLVGLRSVVHCGVEEIDLRLSHIADHPVLLLVLQPGRAMVALEVAPEGGGATRGLGKDAACRPVGIAQDASRLLEHEVECTIARGLLVPVLLQARLAVVLIDGGVTGGTALTALVCGGLDCCSEGGCALLGLFGLGLLAPLCSSIDDGLAMSSVLFLLLSIEGSDEFSSTDQILSGLPRSFLQHIASEQGVSRSGVGDLRRIILPADLVLGCAFDVPLQTTIVRHEAHNTEAHLVEHSVDIVVLVVTGRLEGIFRRAVVAGALDRCSSCSSTGLMLLAVRH